MFGMKPESCEMMCRLGAARIRMQKNKKEIAIKQMRKEISELMRVGKQDFARIRVENIIRDNVTLQAFTILELYLEQIATRAKLIAKTKEIPRDMVEGISSIMYAATRVSDIEELSKLHKLLASKYGKEYAAEASADTTCDKWQVNQNLKKCLLVEPPEPEEKLLVLKGIANEYSVDWDEDAATREMLPHGYSLLETPSLEYPLAQTPSVPSVSQPRSAYPTRPLNSFNDPEEATAAANEAAAYAQALTEHANQLAQQRFPVAAPISPSNSSIAGGSISQGWMLPTPISQGVPASSIQPPVPSPPVDRDATTFPGPGGYRVRTNEEIQRDYDAAPTPEKGPSAPLPVSYPDISNLSQGPPAEAPPQAPQYDDFENLQRRLEALKQ